MDRLTQAMAEHQRNLKPAEQPAGLDIAEDMEKILAAATLGLNTVALGVAELISTKPVRHELDHFSAEVRKGIAFLQCALKLADDALDKL